MEKYDLLANMMEELYSNLILAERKKKIENYKEYINDKKKICIMLSKLLNLYNSGSKTKELINDINILKEKFENIYNNINDKLMIFIVGNGKVGKSTLINALVGEEIAKISFEPCTWKIDVYSPDIKNKAIIKYDNGKVDIVDVAEAKKIIDIEERLSREGKEKFNKAKKEELRKYKNKDERDEIKKKLAKENLYTSNIAEVRWPIKDSSIVENCLFVDTPGLVQNLYNINHMKNINNYYHKADGVIWMIDATTIAGVNVTKSLEALEEELKNES